MVRRECCVPGCGCFSSGAGTNIHHVSFHEFPLLLDVREKWAQAVNRREEDGSLWRPDPNQRAHICSLHFLPEDYREGMKVPRLKKDALPSIFPSVKETQMQKKEKRPITSVKQEAMKQEAMYEVPQKRRRAKELIEPPEEPLPKNSKKFIVSDDDMNIDFSIHETSDDAVRLRRTVQKQEAKIEHLVLENYELRKQLECFNKSDQTSDPELEEFTAMLKTVHERANDENISAMFLLQQLKAYGNKNACWDEKILKHCISWRAKSPSGYQYVRDMNMLKLPSQKTLSKFVEYMSGESG